MSVAPSRTCCPTCREYACTLCSHCKTWAFTCLTDTHTAVISTAVTIFQCSLCLPYPEQSTHLCIALCSVWHVSWAYCCTREYDYSSITFYVCFSSQFRTHRYNFETSLYLLSVSVLTFARCLTGPPSNHWHFSDRQALPQNLASISQVLKLQMWPTACPVKSILISSDLEEGQKFKVMLGYSELKANLDYIVRPYLKN